MKTGVPNPPACLLALSDICPFHRAVPVRQPHKNRPPKLARFDRQARFPLSTERHSALSDICQPHCTLPFRKPGRGKGSGSRSTMTEPSPVFTITRLTSAGGRALVGISGMLECQQRAFEICPIRFVARSFLSGATNRPGRASSGP